MNQSVKDSYTHFDENDHDIRVNTASHRSINNDKLETDVHLKIAIMESIDD